MPTSPCHGTANHCSMLQHSAPKQEQQHHFSTIQHFQDPVLAFKAFPPVSSCLWTTCNILQPVEINPMVSGPQATPGLFECPPHHAMELQIIAACCSILHQSKNSSTISAPFNTFKILSWLSKPFLLSPHACGPHATSCNLWKLIQWSLAPRQPLDYLNAHLTMPWNCQSLQHIAAYCRILHQSKNSFLSPSSSQVQNSAKLCKTASSAPLQHHSRPPSCCPGLPFLLSPHACGPHATPCNLWKLIQWSLTPRPCLDYLNAHLTMPWNCQSLQHIATYCSILQQSKNSFLSPSSSQVQNSAKLPLQHHFSTIQHLQAAVLAFKPSSLSPHACGPHATSCNLLKLIQGSLTPRPPLDYLNAHLTMPWNCKSLQHVAAFCTKARTAAPFQHHSTLSRSCPGFQSLSSCLLMLVDHMQHPATCGN